MTHRTMRLTASPPEALDVEPRRREPGRFGGPADVLGPVRRAADVHVPLGDVGHPGPQRGQVVGGSGARAEPGARTAPVTGQPDQAESALRGKPAQFTL